MLTGTLFFSAMSVFAKLAGERLPTMELVLARVLATFLLEKVVNDLCLHLYRH